MLPTLPNLVSACSSGLYLAALRLYVCVFMCCLMLSQLSPWATLATCQPGFGPSAAGTARQLSIPRTCASKVATWASALTSVNVPCMCSICAAYVQHMQPADSVNRPAARAAIASGEHCNQRQVTTGALASMSSRLCPPCCSCVHPNPQVRGGDSCPSQSQMGQLCPKWPGPSGMGQYARLTQRQALSEGLGLYSALLLAHACAVLCCAWRP